MAAQAPLPSTLPFGKYPFVDDEETEVKQQNPSGKTLGLGTQLQQLSEVVGETVQSVAAKRTGECADDSCLFHGIPVFYNKDGVGFFAGVRAKFGILNEDDLERATWDLKYVRSDTGEFQFYSRFEFPRVLEKPKLGFKFYFGHQKTTEIRFLGSGKQAKDRLDLPFNETRYRHLEYVFRSSIPWQLTRWYSYTFFLEPYWSTEVVHTKPYEANNSLLFKVDPNSVDGGTLTRLGLSLIADSRDFQRMTTNGSLTEFFYEFSSKELGSFDYQRYGIVDRRYFTSGRHTLALRLTYDQLFKNPPFWELYATGGSDPIGSTGSSPIQKGFVKGRFYEKTKVIQNIEYRMKLKPRRFFGQFVEPTWVPTSLDLGALGPQYAWGAASGAMFLMNRSLQIQTFATYADKNFGWHLSFGQEY